MVKGYKVFNPDWTCRRKQYTCPGVFEELVDLKICKRGMHFCKRAADCFDYYSFDKNNHVAEVIAHGEIVEEGNKCCHCGRKDWQNVCNGRQSTGKESICANRGNGTGGMTMDEILCLLACKYAIMEIISKGSVAFTTIIDGKRCRIDWLSVVDYIDCKLEKIEGAGGLENAE